MRIMVFGNPDPLRALYGPAHDVVGRHSWAPVRGPAAYVAFDPAHLARYEAWFPGVTRRATARTREAPLRAGEALYLPVAHDCWLLLLDAPDAFPAALEAAHRLPGAVQTIAVPEPPPDARIEPRAAATYRQQRDRVTPVTHQPLKAAAQADGDGP